MLKELSSVQAYLPFIHAMLAAPDFRDPMLATPAQLHQHLLDAHEDPAKRLFGTFDGGMLTGLFSVLVLPEEGYLQLLAGLSRQAAAYDALLSHLQAAYPGYQADFVYSPQGRLLHTALAARHAAFDPEQQKMVLRSPPPYVPDSRVQLYTPAFRAQYLALHDDDRYWTGERVLAAQDTFRVLLAIDSFKGSVSSAQAEAAVAEGVRRVWPDAEVDTLPLADGGEGTLDAVAACGGEIVTCEVAGPLDKRASARMLVDVERESAVIEMAEAAGIGYSPCTELSALAATTYGVGELMLRAVRAGARTL